MTLMLGVSQIGGLRSGEHDMLSYIQINPIRESEILINAAIDSGVWNWNAPTHVGPNEADLRFIEFFDWAIYEKRSFEFVKVSIIGSRKYPDAKSKQALIKTEDVQFLFDEAEAERHFTERKTFEVL